MLLQSKSSQNSQGKVTGRLRALGRKNRLSRFHKGCWRQPGGAPRGQVAALLSSRGLARLSAVAGAGSGRTGWQDTWPEAI